MQQSFNSRRQKMRLELTWIALAASLLMALGGACMFIFAVKRDYFRDLEEAKFHMFWSDLEDLVNASERETKNFGAKPNEQSKQPAE
jgi:hypothetical protein